MNREIKFRAWDEKKKTMHRDFHLSCQGTPITLSTGMPYEGLHGTKLHLMQFTGLHDKNGKEIYEGDVVKAKWGGVGDVVFQDGGFVSRWDSGEVEYHVCKSDIETRELEVIGNVLENPELIKKSV